MKIGMRRLSLFIVLFTISILSITGMDAYALFDVTSVGEIEDDSDKLLDGVLGTAIYTVGDSTYVVAASENEHGIEIIDISDPTSPTSVGRLADDGSRFLEESVDVAIWYDTSGEAHYAVVAGSRDNGIEIIDISDPTSPTSFGQLEDASGCDTDDIDKTCLAHVSTVAIATIGDSTYVVGAGHGADDGIEIIDISSPDFPTQVGSFSDTTRNSGGCTTGTVCLDRPNDIAIATIGDSTYAVVAAANDDGIAIIDISDPTSPTHVISIVDDATRELEQTYGVAIATIGGSTYAVAVGYQDDGIAIIDISTPASPVYVGELEDGTHTERCSAANGERCLNGPTSVAVETIGGSTYAIVTSKNERAVTVIDITTPSDPTIVAMVYDDNDKELNGAKAVSIATIGDSTYAVVSGWSDDGIEIIHLYTESTITITSSTGGTCSNHIILGNCGTIAINNDEYRIIDTWTNIPTTEVLVGEPVTITLSIPNTPTYTKIHFASVYTEIFDSPTNYEQGAQIGYSIMSDKYSVSKAKLFQVAAATHRITEDPDVKNLDWFEVVFTMIFAKPMDTSHIVVETENKFGIPETLYLTSALKVNENLPQALTLEEKSKFEIEYEQEVIPEIIMDPEPDMDKVTCGDGTILKDKMCVPKEWSFLDFFEKLMKLFG